jgi:fructokinase
MNTRPPLLAGVELGGTKCVCLIGSGPDDIRATVSVATGQDPGATLERIVAVLDAWESTHGAIDALGVASFGPVDVSPRSPQYGHIVATVKPGWSHTDVVGRLARGRSARVAFHTDVNGAALAERRWGGARGLENLAYVTVGTGVGVGLLVGGRPVVGCSHTELGHARIVRADGDTWPGSCPFHRDCVEGLASGTAIAARAGVAAEALPAESPVWDTVAHALAQLLHVIVLATSPQRIFIGGGVLQSRASLLPAIRRRLRASLNGYLELDELDDGGIDRYVAAPGLGALAGPLGALALAADAYAARTPARSVNS